MPGQPLTNALTIDVEDYFQVSAFAPYIARDRWDACECRVERNVERILLMLEEMHTRATFFTLGWIAERYPALVKEIVARGHELASHGYGHLRASDQTPDSFREDLAVAKAILEDTGGVAVTGYRAPRSRNSPENTPPATLLPRMPEMAVVDTSSVVDSRVDA